jgi:cold shock CspA family protein
MLRVVDPPSRTDRAICSPVREAQGGPRDHRYHQEGRRRPRFGFIAAEDEQEYFFDRGSLDSSLDFDRLTGGERVEFEVEQSPKGPRASNVRAA